MTVPPGSALLVAASVLIAGCATYEPPPLTATHPAHPDAAGARPVPPSQTLAYTRADVDAIRSAAVPAHRDPRASGNRGKTVVGEGEVVATTPASSQIVIDHAEIKGFMDAMTMGYRIDPPALLATVKPGDKIRFTIDVDRRAIVHIEALR
ncbi:MAG TPA: copper-binding protein [Terriglobales bacterium]|nr:copper-binding protein [Terriglobales bacterium]